jgi:hypothetical protein
VKLWNCKLKTKSRPQLLKNFVQLAKSQNASAMRLSSIQHDTRFTSGAKQAILSPL